MYAREQPSLGFLIASYGKCGGNSLLVDLPLLERRELLAGGAHDGVGRADEMWVAVAQLTSMYAKTNHLHPVKLSRIDSPSIGAV